MNWLVKLKEIISGWSNDIHATPEILEMAAKRAEICAKCPLNVDNVCSTSKEGLAVKDFEYYDEQRLRGKTYSGCGCPLSKKTKSPTSKCPIGNW
jgi:hypothetical protein